MPSDFTLDQKLGYTSVNAIKNHNAGTSAPSNKGTGELWFDTTQNVLKVWDGANWLPLGTVAAQTADVAVANTVTETTLVGTVTGSATLPTGFWKAGRSVRIFAAGKHGTTGTPTLRLRVKVGGVTVGDTGTVTEATITDQMWSLECALTCRSTGASGSFYAQGAMLHGDGVTGKISAMLNTAASTIDTTAATAVDVTATWGTASASNTITCTNLIIEVLL